MASVIIHGFKDDKQAREWMSWYEGQGEQDAGIWFDAAEMPTPMTDMSKYAPELKDKDGNFVMHVKS